MQTVKSRLLETFPGIVYAFTTRHGGCSIPPYTGLNLAFHVGDEEQNVLYNHRLLARQLGFEHSRLVHMRQIHSERIRLVDGNCSFENPPECDALLTDRCGVPLMAMTADCTAVLLFDPVRRAVAAIHAGRAGAMQGIVPKTVARMRDAFKSDPSDLIAVLGPSIHACCYEVGEAVGNAVEAKGMGYALQKRQERIYLDVNAIVLRQLAAAGVKEERTEVLEQCSACDTERFFSYRAEGTTGRMAGLIMLR